MNTKRQANTPKSYTKKEKIWTDFSPSMALTHPLGVWDKRG